MRSISGMQAIAANQKKLLFSVPINQMHNFSLRVDAACYIGGTDVETGKGLYLAAGDSLGFSHQDFEKEDTGNLDIYAASSNAANIYFLIWRR